MWMGEIMCLFSYTGYLQLGTTASYNMAMDYNVIQSRNNSNGWNITGNAAINPSPIILFGTTDANSPYVLK